MLSSAELAVFFVTFFTCSVVLKFLGVIKNDSSGGPYGLPLLGSIPFLGRYMPKTFYKWWRTYGDVFKVRLGSMDIIVVSGYDTIKAAAEREDDAFSSRAEFVSNTVLRECQGTDTVSFSPFGTIYLQASKVVSSTLRLITKNFKGDDFQDEISEISEKLCRRIERKGRASEAIDITKDIEFSAASVIFKLVYGAGKTESDREKETWEMINFNNEFENLAGSGNAIDVMPWLRYVMPKAIRKLRYTLGLQIKQERREIEEHRKVFSDENLNDFTDFYLKFEKDNDHSETGKAISDLLLCSLKDAFFAGFGTTSATVKWLLLYVTAFPTIQEKIHREIDDVIGDKVNIDISDSKNMHYTMATINEILRLTTIVPFGLPHATAKDVNFMSVDIPKGHPVFFNYYSINHDENTWEEPDMFRPERFLDGSGRLAEEKCRRVVAFGMGRRKCPGERLARVELFIMFTSLLRRFAFAKPEGETFDFTPDVKLVHHPKPYRVVVINR